MARQLIHNRLTPYPLYHRALAPAAQQAHQQLKSQATSIKDELALCRLLLEELLVESGGSDTKGIIEYAKAIGRLVQVQAAIEQSGNADSYYVRQLADDLRTFSDKAQGTLPGGAYFGQGYVPAQAQRGFACPAYGEDDAQPYANKPPM